MRDFFFHILACKIGALGVRGVREEFSGYRTAGTKFAVLEDLYRTYENIFVLEIRERPHWN